MKKTEPRLSKHDKLNKLERAYADKQLSREEYEMWKNIYAKEQMIEEAEVPNSRNIRRRRPNMR